MRHVSSQNNASGLTQIDGLRSQHNSRPGCFRVRAFSRWLKHLVYLSPRQSHVASRTKDSQPPSPTPTLPAPATPALGRPARTRAPPCPRLATTPGGPSSSAHGSRRPWPTRCRQCRRCSPAAKCGWPRWSAGGCRQGARSRSLGCTFFCGAWVVFWVSGALWMAALAF